MSALMATCSTVRPLERYAATSSRRARVARSISTGLAIERSFYYNTKVGESQGFWHEACKDMKYVLITYLKHLNIRIRLLTCRAGRGIVEVLWEKSYLP